MRKYMKMQEVEGKNLIDKSDSQYWYNGSFGPTLFSE